MQGKILPRKLRTIVRTEARSASPILRCLRVWICLLLTYICFRSGQLKHNLTVQMKNRLFKLFILIFIFPICTYFQLLYIIYDKSKTRIIMSGKRSQIRPLWSFDPIPEPPNIIRYTMVDGHNVNCYSYSHSYVSVYFVLVIIM